MKPLVFALLVACGSREEPPPEPAPPPPVEPPVVQKRKSEPPVERLDYEPYQVGVDAAPPPRDPPTQPGELDGDRGRHIVDELNLRCGDALCKGAFDYTFSSVTCAHGACKLAFRAKQADGRIAADALAFDYFGRAVDERGSTAAFRRAITDAVRAWERRQR